MKRTILTLIAALLTGCSALSAREAPVRLSTGDGPALLTNNFARCVGTDVRGGVHVVWYQPSGVAYRRSLDGGRTWEAEVSLGPGEHPSIAVAGDRVYVLWHDVTEGRPRVRMRRSLDRGARWAPTVALSAGSGAHASVAVSGETLVAVWGAGHQGYSEIFARRSADGGATWSAERRLTDVPWDSWVPSIAASGECFYLAWVDLRDGNEDEYLKRSVDRGQTWGPDERLTRSDACSWAPSMVARGDALYFTWFDGRDGEVGVYYKSSRDGGRTWSEDSRLSLPGVEAQHASLAVGGGAVHVVWHQSTGEIRYLRLPATP